MSSLSHAIVQGDFEDAIKMLKNGADPNSDNLNVKILPIFFALEHKHEELVDLLLQKGADANARQPTGETVLMSAVETGNLNIVEMVLMAGGRIEDKGGRFDRTALGYACLKSTPEIVLKLIENGANIHIRGGPFGGTPLEDAVMKNSVPIAEILLQKGADPKARNEKFHRMPLYYAKNTDTEMIELFKKYGGRKVDGFFERFCECDWN